MLMSAVSLVYATRRIANCVALAILIRIPTYLLTSWLIIYVPAEVMPASVFVHPCKLFTAQRYA